ncbi:MAG: DUF3987 domain-containing protein [Candidatus Anammoxibacter sp.]
MELDKIKSIPIQSVAQHLGVSDNGSTKLKCWNIAAHNNGDANPSLNLNVTMNTFKCFTCGVGSSTIDLVMGYRGVNFSQSVKELTEMIGGDVQATPGKSNKKELRVYTLEQTKTNLERSGKKIKCCYIYDAGKQRYIKIMYTYGKDVKKGYFYTEIALNKWVYGRNCDAVLYNQKELKERLDDIVCMPEGESDTDSLKGLGFLTVTSGGTDSLTAKIADPLKGRDIVIFADNDNVGRKDADKRAQILIPIAKSVKQVDITKKWQELFEETMPNKADITDFVSKYKTMHGDDGLKNVIDEMIKGAEEVKEKVELVEVEPIWEDLIPFNGYSGLPAFPFQVFGGIGRDIVEAVADVSQVDPGLTGTIYLSMLSSCLVGKAVVDLKTHIEPVNIYTCSALDSGERKSVTLKTMAKPIYDYQAEKRKDMKILVAESVNLHKIREARLARIQNEAAKAKIGTDREGLQNQASEIAKEITENPVQAEPLYIVDNITPEALGDAMANHDERISMISAEGGIFTIMAGLYNEKGSNLDIFLKAHAGDAWSNHRISRQAQHMDNPFLALCVTVQHEIIKEIGKNTKFRGRGLLARFLYAFCDSKIGYRPRQNKTIADTVLKDYKAHIYGLMDISLDDHVLTLSQEATIAWDEFYNDIENDLKPDNPMSQIKDWGSKLPGAVARIAGLLHFAEHGAEASNIPISVNIVNASCAIGAYYREHALAIFGLMCENQQIQASKSIIEYIVNRKPDKFKGRDILRHKNSFKTMEDVMSGLVMLIERNYIRTVPVNSTGIGRPEAIIYEVNPILLNA